MRDGEHADAGSVAPGDVSSTVESSLGPRLAVVATRTVVVVAVGVMAAGFLGWQAGALVAGLLTVSYLLLATVGPHVPVPWGQGRLLRQLQRAGYHVIPEGASRYLLVGPGGVFIFETRMWRTPVSWRGAEWWLGEIPARRYIDRLTRHAIRLERILGLADVRPDTGVVPVVAVGRHLPRPAMRAGEAIIARPGAAVRQIVGAPEVLDTEDVATVAAAARDS